MSALPTFVRTPLEVVFTFGDIGSLDDDGFLYLSDRKIDMIISGGVNNCPAEIEAVRLSGEPVGAVLRCLARRHRERVGRAVAQRQRARPGPRGRCFVLAGTRGVGRCRSGVGIGRGFLDLRCGGGVGRVIGSTAGGQGTEGRDRTDGEREPPGYARRAVGDGVGGEARPATRPDSSAARAGRWRRDEFPEVVQGTFARVRLDR